MIGRIGRSFKTEFGIDAHTHKLERWDSFPKSTINESEITLCVLG